MAAWNQHWANICFNSLFCILCNSKKFYVTAHFFGIFDIFCCNLGNSFNINIVKNNSGIKCHRCENCHFSSCIQSFDISSRISLRISQLCCKCKCIFEFHSILRHLRKNKVCSTVYNTHNFCHMVACKTFFQWSDDRNSTSYCCFKQKIHMICLCRIKKLFSMYCDQILICCNRMFAGIQCCQYVASCRFNSTDQLDHNINFRIIYDFIPIVGQNGRIFNLCSSFFQITYQNLLDFNLTSKLRNHVLFLLL